MNLKTHTFKMGVVMFCISVSLDTHQKSVSKITHFKIDIVPTKRYSYLRVNADDGLNL